MAPTQITRSDVLEWNSLDAIADSIAKRGLDINNSNQQGGIPLQFDDGGRILVETVHNLTKDEMMDVLERIDGRYSSILLASDEYRRFDIFSKIDSAPAYGQLDFDHFGFDFQEVVQEGTDSRRIIERLNRIEGYDSDSIERLYSDLGIIEEFTKGYQALLEDFTERISVQGGIEADSRRQYAQRCLNRLIYLNLLQELDILEDGYLEDEHGRISYSGRDTFEELYEPLFHGELPSDTAESAEPFMQNFLFEQSPIEEEYPGIRPADSTEEVNELFERVLKFLRGWDWHIARGYNLRRTTWVTPRVIGHALERYINDQDGGTYHTPERLARFIVRESFQKSLISELNSVIDEEYDTIEQLFDEGTTEEIEHLYFDVLSDFHVVDPAVGSGSFIERGVDLLSDVYIECFRRLEHDGSSRLSELPSYQSDIDRILLAKEMATRRNLCGVDLNPVARELTQFRLNLSLLSAVTNRNQIRLRSLQLKSGFNFWNGNSLIGFVNPEEAVEDGFQNRLGMYSQDYSDLYQAFRRYRQGLSNSSNNTAQIESALSELQEKIDQRFVEQLSEIVSHAPDEEILDNLHPFHWYLAFPDILEEGGFDVVVSNPPWRDLEKEVTDYRTGTDDGADYRYQREYFEESDDYRFRASGDGTLSSLFIQRARSIAADEAIITMLIPEEIFSDPGHSELRDHLLRKTDVTYAIGFENHGIFPDFHRQFRFGLLQFQNSGETRTIGTKFRQTNLDILDSPSDSFLEIPAELIREYSPTRLSFPAVEVEDDVKTLQQIVQHASLESERGWNIETFRGLHQAREAEYLFDEEEHVSYPIYAGRNIYQFVHDSRFFDLDRASYWGIAEDGDGPSAKTRIRERELDGLQRRFGDITLDSGEVTFGDGASMDSGDVPMPFDEYRIAYRDIARASDERTFIASVIPPGVVCLNTLHTIHPYDWSRRASQEGVTSPDELFSLTYDSEELFCLLGILNSIPFDYLIRTKVGVHLSDYLVKESQAPRLTDESPWFDHIWRPAAQLNCYGDSFSSLRSDLDITSLSNEERRRAARAEIDAAVFRAYGFEDDDIVISVLDSFPVVRSPRVMDDRYIDMVLEEFGNLERGEQ
ncbi:Eco57I restriction-modification methylase domain-containing protein [Haloglomus litoreum]|uniref:Eco57I restriction-modification methylase domain-containing protein n=1 Tax=Haloglomus litoreum TaxID=3034026 RepID=UPI0023E7C4B8|nr:hypothetical protein [Haloglomus sp. DT116]